MSLVAEKPCQPNSPFTFPKIAFGKQSHSCQSRWFTEFNWLDYDEVSDFVTCFICKKHLKNLEMEENKEEAFLSTVFHNWRKALDRAQRTSKFEMSHYSINFRGNSASVRQYPRNNQQENQI